MLRILPRASRVLPMLALAVLLSACEKKATGQVAAVVNGDEITLQQLNAEAGAAKLTNGTPKDTIRTLALQSLVEKQLLEQQAKSAGLDRDPEFLLRQRQVDQALLLQFYAKKAQDTMRVPDQATVAKFVTDHPGTFADRTIFTVDQLRFAPSQDSSLLAGLKDLHSMNAIATFLTGKGVSFQRGNGNIDSAQVPPLTVKQVLALPPGEPFVVPSAQGVVVSVVTGRTAASPPAQQSQLAAVQMIRSQALEALIQKRLKDAKAQAKIVYQPGFGPSKASSPTAANK